MHRQECSLLCTVAGADVISFPSGSKVETRGVCTTSDMAGMPGSIAKRRMQKGMTY